jgi:hypothetical protein
MLLSLGQSLPGCTAGTTYGMTVPCKRLQQQLRALKGDPERVAEHRAILQQYKKRVKHLVRQYRVEVALERARQWRGRIGTAFGAGTGLMGPAAPSQLRPTIHCRSFWYQAQQLQS